MGTSLSVAADLRFSVKVPVPDGVDRVVEGTLRGQRSNLLLEVTDPTAFAGKAGLQLARRLGGTVASAGVRVTVVGPRGPVLALGAVRSSWMHRRLTGSRHLRIVRPGVALPLLRRRRDGATSVLSPMPLLPPPTVLPVAPTFRRLRRRPATTTHDPEGGGRPRLVFAPGPAPWPDDRQPVFPLLPWVTTIGSGASADLRLEGLAEQHAEIRRTSADEFVLVQLSRTGDTFLNGERMPVMDGTPQREHLLRTGSRLDLGRWTMSYFREEYADHGRPHGGRIGGEAGHQKPQPPRQPLRNPASH